MRSFATLTLALCLAAGAAGLDRPTIAPPDLGALVAVPVTSATTCVRIELDVPARGPAVLTGVSTGEWRGLSLPTGTEGFVPASAPPPPDDLSLRLAHGFGGVAVALDGREVATLGDELAPAAAALRGALAAAVLAARRAGDDRLPGALLEADADVPFAHVALVAALVAEQGLFCGFAPGPDDPPADARRTIARGLRGHAPVDAALTLRADGAAQWRAVSELLDAAAGLGVGRFTFVVLLRGPAGAQERPLESPARAGPARIFFPEAER